MPRIVRFLRLDRFGEDAIDLDLCRRVIVGRRTFSDRPWPIDEDTISIFFRMPDSHRMPDGRPRWLQGMGGPRQHLAEGVGTYHEVHPITVAQTMRLVGWDPLPPEFEQYRPFLHLSLIDAPAAWEASQRLSTAQPAHVEETRVDPRLLAAQGFVRKTTRQMHEEFEVSTGRLEDMGNRALAKNKIADWKRCTEGHLWILPKKVGHSGT